MLDYEITGYVVEWRRHSIDKIRKFSRKFDTEEEAIEFAKEHRANWLEYRIEQRRVAIIDF